MEMVKQPNLFEFATSELSQDAFICWLLKWSEPHHQDTALHKISLEFLKNIFDKHDIQFPADIHSIEVHRQVDQIDVLAIVNQTHAILIEDKTFTKEHHNQLTRYLNAAEEKGDYLVLPIYYKTGNQSDLTKLLNAGYQTLERNEILTLLEKGEEYGVESDIFRDYFHYVKGLETKYNRYRTEPISMWNTHAWEGFYIDLQKHVTGNWGYVSNPSGGFMGFWWGGYALEDYKVYLQLEQNTLHTSELDQPKSYGQLCIKIDVPNTEAQSKKRNDIFNLIKQNAPNYELDLVKPKRFGKGKTMTVTVLNDEFRRIGEDGLIDMNQTVKLMKTVEGFIDNLKQLLVR